MNINRSAIKSNAKTTITNTRPSLVLIALVYLVIMYLLSLLSQMVDGSFSAYMDTIRHYMQGNYDYLPTLPQIGTLAYIIIIALGLMIMMMNTGFTIACFNAAGFRKVSFGNLFDGFTIFFKVLWLNILIGIFIYLWTLLFIIPGIVAAYRYRLALYIMLDNPEMSALDCISESKLLMTGHKGELFVLDWSFLGWMLLTIVPFVSIWVTPYTNVTYINYYIALRDMPYPGSQSQQYYGN